MGDRARAALAHSRFADVRWVAETGSTNSDAMALARNAAPEGIVLVADHQTAGRGRLGRTWSSPPNAALLLSILFRPPIEVVGLVPMAVAVAAAVAVDQVAGFAPRLKWPNDLVVPADGGGPDRKLAGILAELDWPAGSAVDAGWRPPRPGQRAVLVVGLGLNLNWPDPLPEELHELAELAVAANRVAGRPVDREEVLIAMLRELDRLYGRLSEGTAGRDEVMQTWRQQSATLGRRVRIDLGAETIEGTAADVTAEGHLLVETAQGRRELAVGDVVHLRPDPPTRW